MACFTVAVLWDGETGLRDVSGTNHVMIGWTEMDYCGVLAWTWWLEMICFPGSWDLHRLAMFRVFQFSAPISFRYFITVRRSFRCSFTRWCRSLFSCKFSCKYSCKFSFYTRVISGRQEAFSKNGAANIQNTKVIYISLVNHVKRFCFTATFTYAARDDGPSDVRR